MKKLKMVFSRYEKKYLLSEAQFKSFISNIQEHIKEDNFGSTIISNIYFDTPSFLLIRKSIEKPIYKEKLRIRCYGKATLDSPAFIEIKKKFQGIVSKRRVSMSLREAEKYLYNQEPLRNPSQISKEIQWMLQFYKELAPRIFISYKRIVFLGKSDPEVRITIDENILWRDYDLTLAKGIYGSPLIKEREKLMEIKILGAMPLWLSAALDQLNIYPTSFSKYGNAYKNLINEEKNNQLEAN